MILAADVATTNQQVISNEYNEDGTVMAAINAQSAADIQNLQTYQTSVYAGPYTVSTSSGTVGGQASNQIFLGKPTWAYQHPYLLGAILAAVGAAAGAAAIGLLRR